MPNHVHALLAFTNTGTSINTIVANAKRFMAYDIVKRLEEGKKTLALKRTTKRIEQYRTEAEGKKYGVFEPSI